MSEWYVYRHDSEPLGPLTTEAVADAILVGDFTHDAWVAPPGGVRWVRASEVPVIAAALDGVVTRVAKRRPEHGDFGSSMMVVESRELLPSIDLRDTAEMSALPAMSVRLPAVPDDDSSGKLGR